MKLEHREIDGLRYWRYAERHTFDQTTRQSQFVRTPDPERGFWRPEGPTGGLVCACGSRTFSVVFSGAYETSARCSQCGWQEVVHDG
jgi:hypothetical protein